MSDKNVWRPGLTHSHTCTTLKRTHMYSPKHVHTCTTLHKTVKIICCDCDKTTVSSDPLTAKPSFLSHNKFTTTRVSKPGRFFSKPGFQVFCSRRIRDPRIPGMANGSTKHYSRHAACLDSSPVAAVLSQAAAM